MIARHGREDGQSRLTLKQRLLDLGGQQERAIAAENIARAIEAAAPVPHRPMCEAWCQRCTRYSQAKYDAALARRPAVTR